MDLHGTAWTGFMSDIQSNVETCKKDDGDLSLYLGRIQGLLKRKSHLYWHIDYFQKYVDEDINPQGLRLNTFPTIKNPTEEFKRSWEDVLNTGSKSLMLLLIKQYTLDMSLLDKEIDSLNEQYPHVFEITSFGVKWKEIRERLETMNKEIVTKKQKKCNLDKLAFSQGYAYKWQNKNTGRGPGRRPGTHTQSHVEDTTESDSSLSMFPLSQGHNRHSAAQTARSVKRTRHGGGSSPSDPKNKKRSERAPQSKEQGTTSNLTPALQNILQKDYRVFWLSCLSLW